MNPPIILLYHQISDLPAALDPYGISVTPDDFARQMAYLHDNGYRVMRLSDAVRALRDGETLPQKAVTITFDDGYRDNLTHALPVLQRYDFPATVYLVAERVGESAVWDAPHGEQLPLLTWNEIRQMQAAGVEFGSHTRTHAALDTLDAEQARWELCTSREIIADNLNAPPVTIAYPYEQFTGQTQTIAAQCGYLGACGTSRMAETLFNLWRVEIGKAEADFSRFERKLSPLWKPLTQVRRRLRPLKNFLR